MNNSLILKQILNADLPKEYKEFIDSKGFVSRDGLEIYGYSPKLDLHKIPCVIGATNLYKKLYPIKENELVIAFDDLENSPLLLNIEDGHIYKIKNNNSREIIYSNFQEFYNEFIKNK